MDKIKYENEIDRQLSDIDTYKKWKMNLTEVIKKKFITFIKTYEQKETISKGEKEFLIIHEQNTPVIYVLPKIHKDLLNPPGRPIIAGTNSITSNLSHFIDHYLQTLVVSTRSYLKDTRDVLNKINALQWKENYFLVTADVTSLYTIIKHTDGVEAVTSSLNKTDLSHDLINMILEDIKFILENNYFHFNGEYYLQTMGTAMGTRFAPSYANLFMNHCELLIVWTGHAYGGNLVSWLRYIDDVLFIWKGNTHLNDNNYNIKLSFEISQEEINFLDLTIYPKN